MRRSGTIRRQAAGFTLVELIVVIGIISLLIGLLLAAISKARDAGPRVQTRADISNLSVAIESFKTTYQVNYIPTCLVMSSDYTADPASVALQDSRQYFARVWPKAIVNGKTSWPAPKTTLDGNMVLVLFLGGTPPARQGVLNSPSNPFQVPADGSVAKGPFFDFKPERVNAAGQYLDPYGNPYYYFSSVNGNDYDYFGKRYYDLAPDNSPNLDSCKVPGMNREGGFGSAVFNTAVAPFRGIDGKYINPNGYQIISMGKDGKPGRGSPCDPAAWVPAASPWPQRVCPPTSYMLYDAGIGDYSPGAVGGDDISNFAKGPLGGSN